MQKATDIFKEGLVKKALHVTVWEMSEQIFIKVHASVLENFETYVRHVWLVNERVVRLGET